MSPTDGRPGPSSLPPFTLVTGNPSKVEETRRILEGLASERGLGPAEMDHVSVDLPEIQSADLLEVLRVKGEEARERLGRPLVVEETGLELAAFNGFPGPLVKWMLEAVGAEGIARAAHALAEPRATARCAVLLLDGEREVVGIGETRGELVLPPRGSHGFGWDPVFQPDGHTLTYAELGDDTKDAIGHRGRAWQDLLGKVG